MEDQVILLRRRDVNYYTDYAEKYLEQVFKAQGLHLTLRQENRVQVCSMQYDRKPDLIFRSPMLQTMTLAETEDIVRRLGMAFNTVAVTAPASAFPLPADGNGVIEYGLTPGPGAFDELPFLTEGTPFVDWRSYPLLCRNDGCRKEAALLNYGGIGQGLSVSLTMPESYACADFCVEIKDWRHFKNRYLPVDVFIYRAEPETKTCGDMQILRWEFPTLELPEGVNLFSRKLLGPHKTEMENARQIVVAFRLEGADPVFRDVTLTVTAAGGNTVELPFPNTLPVPPAAPMRQAPPPAYAPEQPSAVFAGTPEAAPDAYAEAAAPEQTAAVQAAPDAE